MKESSKISLRELWLVSLLPAALVLIASMGLPGPGDEIEVVEERLGRLTGSDMQARLAGQLGDASAEIRDIRAQIADLDEIEAELRSRLEVVRAPLEAAAQKLEMTEALDELTQRLSAHGVRVLGMKRVGVRSTGTTSSASARSRRRRGPTRSPAPRSAASSTAATNGSERPTEWQVSLAATWPAVHAALADTEAFPAGLWLAALSMEPARPNSSLHRWELFVKDGGAL